MSPLQPSNEVVCRLTGHMCRHAACIRASVADPPGRPARTGCRLHRSWRRHRPCHRTQHAGAEMDVVVADIEFDASERVRDELLPLGRRDRRAHRRVACRAGLGAWRDDLRRARRDRRARQQPASPGGRAGRAGMRRSATSSGSWARDELPHLVGVVNQVVSGDVGGASVGLGQSCEDAHGGGLARSVRAQWAGDRP